MTLSLSGASSFAVFDVNQTAAPGFTTSIIQFPSPRDSVNQIEATQINGVYNEGVQIPGITGYSGGYLSGIFATQILFIADSFTATGSIVYSGISRTQGTPLSYGIYGTFNGIGTFTQTADGANPSNTDPTFTFSVDTFSLMLDPNTATNINRLLSGALTPAPCGMLLLSGNDSLNGLGVQVIKHGPDVRKRTK